MHCAKRTNTSFISDTSVSVGRCAQNWTARENDIFPPLELPSCCQFEHAEVSKNLIFLRSLNRCFRRFSLDGISKRATMYYTLFGERHRLYGRFSLKSFEKSKTKIMMLIPYKEIKTMKYNIAKIFGESLLRF